MPGSLLEAFRLCKDHAREERGLSVERIADLMALTADTVYKYLATGRMPGTLIPVYEHVCGVHYVSRFLAASSGYLVIPVPTGKGVSPADVQALQSVLNEAVGAILEFAAQRSDADKTLSAIHAGMCALAWHHGNVGRAAQPELELS
ncbi:hypothetical protein [Burkholderia sp. Ac-20345]|uniref:hypothetical protein n=1 Tax=Burkholderia sp. Ac-20345 TaxID=2703891 RepID=UPI001F11E2B9|nr:hypothetical protein [Burkholderia sp. Ac-20345]